ncbi:19929_t:CDS:2 [Cetraspora pellucida]|uniref:Plasma membrane fusion protein PRM1 n=1 Tax=Cetraspora pellucida TaxID=1433469 RepID=A0A9N8ZMG9_9GLOM|nr:19929_t:CDS:2 [Cetraspora pellucida]
MPLKTNKIASPGALSTGFALPSPSLQAEEGFRYKSSGSPTYNTEKQSLGINDFSEKHPPNPLKSPTNIQPYVGLHGRLSLAWITYPIIALLFITLRLIIAMSSIQPLVDEVKDKALKSCNSLELATSTLISLPHFMADGFNRATVDSVNLSIKGASKALDFGILALEGIIVWIIHLYKSTFKCLLELVINGSLSSIAEAVRVLQAFSTTQLTNIKTGIDKDISSVNAALNSVRTAISTAGSLIGGINVPTVTIPSADALNSFQLPTSNNVAGLDALSQNIPTIADIETKLDNIVTIPFEQLRILVQSTMSNLTFNQTVLPVPPPNNLKFCANSLDLSVLDQLSHDLIKAATIGIVIIFIIGLLMILINAFYILISYKRFMIHVNRTVTTVQLITVNPSRESILDIIKIAEHPLISLWIIKTSKIFKRTENQNLFRWYWDYILYKPALICLTIGIAGVLGIYLQIAILNVVRQNYRAPIQQAISAFGDTVLNLMNSQLNNTSQQFANGSNSVLSTLENGINQDLFGWVNITTTTLNNTLNAAVDDISSFIQTTFQGVPALATSIQQILNCLIFVKIEGIQAGLTFIKDHAFIELPRVNNNILMISPLRMQEAVSKTTDQLVGPQNDNSNGGEIGGIFDEYENKLRSELTLFLVLIGAYVVVVLMGVIYVLWFIYQRRRRNNTLLKEESLKKSLKEEPMKNFTLPSESSRSKNRQPPSLPPKPIYLIK